MVIPAGLAFAEALKKRPDLVMYRTDHFHPSEAGTYLAGCVTYATMYHRSPIGLKFYGVEKVPEKDALFLQQVAWDTVTDFFGWQK